MEAVFLKILNMSITASYLVLAVVLVRPLLKKAPKFITVILWGLVAARLICPFSMDSVLSLIPSAETVPSDIIYAETPQIYSGISQVNTVVNNIVLPAVSPNASDSVNPMQVIVFAASIVWLAGIAAMLLYMLISYARIRFKVREAAQRDSNIWECDRIDTPFILGVIKPKIYLPSAMSEADREYVIAHEHAHIKRRDHLWKPLGFLLLTVYWFNPVLWLGYILLCRDIELACDEKVIKEMGEQSKKSYSDALINCSVPRKMVAACPLAFGETGVKARIKSVLNYKKPAFWVIITAVVLSIAVAVCFMTNPAGIKITAIDDFGFHSEMFDSVEELNVTASEMQYEISNEEDIEQIIEQLKKVRVRKDEISKSRAEDRDKTNGIVLGEYQTLYFSGDFGEVWCSDSLKPSFSYKVLNPNAVKNIFDIATRTSKASVIITNEDSYIQFYDKPTDENQTPVIAKQAVIDGTDFSTLLNILENQQWVDDRVVDRLAHNYDGRIFYNGKWIYFGYSQKIIYYDTYSCSVETQILETIAKYENSALAYGTTAEQLEYLREEYPDYFGLDISNGLELYISEFAEGLYKCELFSVSDYNFAHSALDINTENGATLEEMKIILSSYDISSDKLYVLPYRNPLSSYYYAIDDAYCEKLKLLFGSTASIPYNPS